MGSASGRVDGDGKDNVAFSVFAETTPGSGVRVVGSVADLGDWCPEAGLKLTTSPGAYPRWSVSAKLPSNLASPASVEYKYVIIKPDGSVVWENRPNRILQIDGDGSAPERTPWFGDEDKPDPLTSASNTNGCDTGLPQAPVTPPEAAPVTPPKAAPVTPPEASDKRRERALSHDLPCLPPRKPSAKAAEAPEAGESHVVPLSHKRCPSLPNLGLLVEPVTSAWSRQQTPDAGAQNIVISLEGVDDVEAESMVIQVVFEESGSLHQLRYRPEKQIWVLVFAETELPPGVYLFHFLLNGVRTLSRNHPTYGNSNAALFNDPVRRYILARQAREAAVNSDAINHKSKVMSPAKRMGGRRAFSIGNNLAALAGDFSDDSDEDDVNFGAAHAQGPTAHGSDAFPESIFAGLFDTELRLRLHSFTLPEVPPSPGKRNMMLKHGAYQLSKKYGNGRSEDAYFASHNALGVADGVGCMVQFASYGVNAADYAADLMECAKKSLAPGGKACEDVLDCPVEERAVAACDAGEHGAKAYGASTMVVLCLDGNTVGVANLGDSGFMLLRKGPSGMTIALKSDEQQHSWNCPYQLTRLPPALVRKFPKLDQDNATDCNTYRLEVYEGDLLLVFSDGVRDNVHDHEILQVVDRTLSPAFAEMLDFPQHATDPQDIAKALVYAAQHRSLDPHAKVPFTLYSRRHGYDCPGGKDDDITVVAAWVVPDGGSTIPALVE